MGPSVAGGYGRDAAVQGSMYGRDAGIQGSLESLPRNNFQGREVGIQGSYYGRDASVQGSVPFGQNRDIQTSI